MRSAGLLCVVLLVGGCAQQDDFPTPRERLAAHLEAVPDHPVAVPVTLPAGYRLAFTPGGFTPPRGAAGINVCALPVGADPLGRCVGLSDDSPWFATTTVDGQLQVVVQTTTGGATARDLDPWRRLDYTGDLDGVVWLAEGGAA